MHFNTRCVVKRLLSREGNKKEKRESEVFLNDDRTIRKYSRANDHMTLTGYGVSTLRTRFVLLIQERVRIQGALYSIVNENRKCKCSRTFFCDYKMCLMCKILEC